MHRPTARLLPVLVTAGVVVFIYFLQWLLTFLPGVNLIERAELFTYDWRAQFAYRNSSPPPKRLKVIYVDDESVAALANSPGKHQWPWSRDVYGRVIRELKAEGAKVIGIDGFFTELHVPIPKPGLGGLTSDEFLARQLAAAGNVVLTTASYDIHTRPVSLLPTPDLFATNALALAQDGVRGLSSHNSDRLRSLSAFIDTPSHKPAWQLALLMAAYDLGLDLDHAQIRGDAIVLLRHQGPPLTVPLADEHQVYIDWRVNFGRYDDLEQPFRRYYHNALRRERGEPVTDSLKDCLVLIGFTLAGDRADDWGPTPIADHVPHCLAHLNLLVSMLSGQFIVRAGPWTERLLVAAMAALSGLLGWRLRWGWGLAAFIVVLVAYWAMAVTLFMRTRYWLPVAAPLFGAFVMGYVCLFTYRIALERLERRQVRSVFGKMVSPNIFNLLVRQPASALDTSRREVTIYFADVRGFTRFMEEDHTRMLKRLDTAHLQSATAQEIISQGVRQSLETVNGYLGAIADEIKANDGTLDKYIGDCVMAFWGAPVPDPQHALKAVQAAIAIQRALHAVNLQRTLENERRQTENIKRLAAGLKQLDLLPVLRVGSALNSGTVTVGFMGSPVHVSNYTAFGREVNIASRLEGVAEADSILVTEGTWLEVNKFAPELAATLVRREPVLLHGFSKPVQVYEVPWREDQRPKPEQTQGTQPLKPQPPPQAS